MLAAGTCKEISFGKPIAKFYSPQQYNIKLLLWLRYYSSLEVAAEYFRSGADKISIGSDAVYAAEEFLKSGVSLHFELFFVLVSNDRRIIKSPYLVFLVGEDRKE